MPNELGGVALGKFAGYPEFLRPGAGDEALDSLDTWMDEGTQAAHERWGTEWKTAFLMGAAYGFLWSGGPGATPLCGVLAPSRDGVGRDFPLAVATRFPPALVTRAPHIVPLAFGDFLDEAYALADEARATPMGVGDFEARVRSLGGVSADEILRAEAEYAQWAHRTRLAEGWAAVFPVGRPLEEAAAALEAIGAALAPVRARSSQRSLVVLRLPLGAGGVAAAALWLDIVLRICRSASLLPSAFWSVDDGTMLVPIGTVQARTFSELWRPVAESGYVCGGPDSSPWSHQSREAFDPARVLRSLDAGSSMSVFLDALAR